MNIIAMHPLFLVIPLGLAIAAVPLLLLWLEDRRLAALHERVFRERGLAAEFTEIERESVEEWHAYEVPKVGGAGRMTEEERSAALTELLWQWEFFGRSAYTTEAVMEVCSMSPQQAAAFMHWARGQVLWPAGPEPYGQKRQTYRCIVEPGSHGTRWLRFREVMPAAAKWPLIDSALRPHPAAEEVR